MKKLISTMLVAALALAGSVHAQIAMPAPSPTQTIIQNFGAGTITLTYSRPSIRGRSVFGENTLLAPLNKPWRTGANAATKIKFTDPVSIGNKMLDSGSYVIYTIPGQREWDIVISKGTAYPGQQGFTENDDLVHVKAPASSVAEHTETFTMQFANLQNESCELVFKWGNTQVPLSITTSIKDKLRAQIESAMQGQNKPYQQAATYYYEYEKDYKKALDFINKGIEGSPNAFWLYMLKARIQKAAGDVKGAKESAGKTIDLATKANNDDYVRMAKDFMSN